METSTYKLHRRARMVLNQLTETEQKRVLDRLATLMEIPVEQWPAVWVKRLPGEPTMYLFRIDDSLRGILQVDGGQTPELMDLVRHETLESFTKTAEKNDH